MTIENIGKQEVFSAILYGSGKHFLNANVWRETEKNPCE